MKKPLFSLLFATLLSPLFSQIPNYVPTTNLEGWWSFDGNADDASSSGNNFTINGATLTTDRFTGANSAYDFNGTNQYLILSNPSFTLGQTSSFSVSFWAQRSATGYGVTLMHGSSTNGNFIWLFQSGSNGSFQFGTNKQGSPWVWAPTTYTPPNWEHYVGVYDNGSMTFYQNGIQVATATNLHTSVGSVNLPLYVGRGVGGAYFDGKVDDLGIWTRVLTQNEIDALYAGCTVISNHPQDTLARVSDDLKLGVVAANPTATYKWQMDDGNGFQNLTNGGQFNGVSADSLLISSLSFTNDGSNFRCIVDSGSACVDTSLIATLSICGKITQEPRDTAVLSNSVALFNINSNDPSATFKWQSDIGSGFVDVVNSFQYAGATTSSLSISNLSPSNDGQVFRCLVNSSTCADTSYEATLTLAYIGLEESLNNALSIFPNPGKGVFKVKVNAHLSNKAYSIINSLGQVVARGELNGTENTINLDSFAPGHYMFQVEELKKTFVIQD